METISYKLIKVDDYYRLVNKFIIIIGTTDLEYQQTFPDVCKKLSLDNCHAVVNGYDLDKIVEQTKQTLEDSRISSYDSFKIGFQKALELLGDKKFSEEDLIKGIDKGIEIGSSNCKWDLKRYDYVQSLQQTEWDVIIEMECPECKEYGYISECRNNCNQKFLQPKLDADGCLILKRK